MNYRITTEKGKLDINLILLFRLIILLTIIGLKISAFNILNLEFNTTLPRPYKDLQINPRDVKKSSEKTSTDTIGIPAFRRAGQPKIGADEE